MQQDHIQVEETIWQNRVFMKLFASYSVSMLGQWFDIVAVLILFSYVWQVNPMMIALIPVAYALPQVLLGQFAGVLTDKIHKVKIMMVSDFVTAALTFFLFFTNNPWLALLILSLRSTVNVVHGPAQQGLIKLVVKEQLIMKAITLNGSVNQLSKIIGPFMGASLISFVSPKICILINAIAFTISAFILLFILLDKQMVKQTTVPSKSTDSDESFWTAWLQGWKLIIKKKVLLISVTASFIGFIAIQMVDIQFPIFFREIAPNLPEITGWLMGASGLGAFVMIMILNYKTLKHFGVLFGLSMLLMGVGFGGIGLLREGFSLVLPVLLGFMIGLGVGLLSITLQYLIQTQTTESEVGRVSGIVNSILSLTVLLPPIIGGVLVQMFGVVALFVVSGAFLFFLGIGLMLSNSLFNDKKEMIEEQVRV
ncbi:MFS transporter [Anaerobacillus alkaliphilus]|uniref:MFS transporter n=1 Tax=Anaerobacillus alkaliphilus TaxID=1548597 RepID=A0A4Q0VML8_9BACI|nr:MFS transporter [Anaerobacillus alkaliphilus]RXI96206.1 MFS transporter [Anaerobacillus alkaliphilus]